MPLSLILSAEKIHPQATSAVFYAVVIDEAGNVIRRVPIHRIRPGEFIELAIERKSIFLDNRTGENPEVPGD